MYSSHLAGKINKSLSINTLSSSTIGLTDKFGGGTVKIESDFPLKPLVKIQFETRKKKNFILEFRLPANTSLAGVNVNGEKIKSEQNKRGFFEIDRKWKSSDVIEVEMTYELNTTTIQLF